MSTREAPAFLAQVLITAAEVDELVLNLAREKFRARGFRLKQAELVKRAQLVPHAPPQGVVVTLEDR